MSDCARITVHVDGEPIECWRGQTVAAAMLASGKRPLGRSLATGQPRGVYCGMGVCFECEVGVEGRGQVRACLEDATAGMVVRTSLPRNVAGSAGPEGSHGP